jgi:hypothetical protein
MQESAFRHPFHLIDENAMHHGDLTGRSAEAQQRDAHPDAERLPERNAVSGFRHDDWMSRFCHFFLPVRTV